MEKKIMVLIIVLGIASLAVAQNPAQNIINSKISEAYYKNSLCDGVVPAVVLWQYSSSGYNQKGNIQPQKTNVFVKEQGYLNQPKHAGSRNSKPVAGIKTLNVRTIYN